MRGPSGHEEEGEKGSEHAILEQAYLWSRTQVGLVAPFPVAVHVCAEADAVLGVEALKVEADKEGEPLHDPLVVDGAHALPLRMHHLHARTVDAARRRAAGAEIARGGAATRHVVARLRRLVVDGEDNVAREAVPGRGEGDEEETGEEEGKHERHEERPRPWLLH